MKVQVMRSTLSILFLLLMVSCHQQQASDSINPSVELENPFIHTVYFWFKENVSEEQLEEFYADTEKLREIEVVKALYAGKPANTTRPIVERSYDFALVVHFNDLAAHDVYQQHPTHLALLEKGANLWEKVMITDIE